MTLLVLVSLVGPTIGLIVVVMVAAYAARRWF